MGWVRSRRVHGGLGRNLFEDGEIVSILRSLASVAGGLGLADQVLISLAQQADHVASVGRRRSRKSFFQHRRGLLILAVGHQRPCLVEDLGGASCGTERLAEDAQDKQHEGDQESLSHDIRVLLRDSESPRREGHRQDRLGRVLGSMLGSAQTVNTNPGSKGCTESMSRCHAYRSEYHAYRSGGCTHPPMARHFGVVPSPGATFDIRPNLRWMVNGCGKVTGFALDPPGLGSVVTIGAEALGIPRASAAST